MSNTSISPSSSSSSEVVSSSSMVFSWCFLALHRLLFLFIFVLSLHFFNSSRTSSTLTTVLSFETFLLPFLRSFLSEKILAMSANRRFRIVFSPTSCRFRESTLGSSQCTGVLISFSMVNSNNLEFSISSAVASSISDIFERWIGRGCWVRRLWCGWWIARWSHDVYFDLLEPIQMKPSWSNILFCESFWPCSDIAFYTFHFF